jgi:aminoglycoside 6'-N-acetyltransferase I
MHIIDLVPGDEEAIRQAAALLVKEFRGQPPAWPDMDAALEEVREILEPDHVCRAAVDEQGVVLGWIGGEPHYEGHVWELHPLVVRADHQRQGIGRALVEDLEEQVRARGADTLWLGADDQDNGTSLFGVDLYPDPLAHLARIENLGEHPYEFYQKMGFVIVGVMPDANGPGKPDIYLAKRV